MHYRAIITKGGSFHQCKSEALKANSVWTTFMKEVKTSTRIISASTRMIRMVKDCHHLSLQLKSFAIQGADVSTSCDEDIDGI
jgi:hypothetical protein